MTGYFNRWFNKVFRKKILLNPLPNGTFEAIDVTENTEYIQKEDGSATVISPALIFPVTGLKNIAYIAIKEYDQAILLNPFDPVSTGLTEKALWSIIDGSVAYGRNMAEGTGEEDKKSKGRALITMIAAIAAAVFAVLIYMKIGT